MIYKQAKQLNSPSSAVLWVSPCVCFFFFIYKCQLVTCLIHRLPRFKLKSTCESFWVEPDASLRGSPGAYFVSGLLNIRWGLSAWVCCPVRLLTAPHGSLPFRNRMFSRNCVVCHYCESCIYSSFFPTTEGQMVCVLSKEWAKLYSPLLTREIPAYK